MSSEDVVDIVDIEVARTKMRTWRTEGYRNSDEVIDIGECLLLEHASKLGDEKWAIYEQVAMAALDFGRLELASECIEALRKQFPKSARVMRLSGMLFEADGDYERADSIYESLLEEDPANVLLRKRRVAILKAQQRVTEAIDELNEYLTTFMSYQEAWMELSELYIGLQEYSKAAFCLEELILQQPHNHLYHERYAEVQYTIGTHEAVERARKYFAQALKLEPNNRRALLGLFLSSSASGQSKSHSAKRSGLNSRVSTWAAEQIQDILGSSLNETQKKTLDEICSGLQLAIPQNIPEH